MFEVKRKSIMTALIATIAVILAFFMCITTVDAESGNHGEGKYTIQVKTGDKAINDATVNFEVTVDGKTEINESKKTDEDGFVVVGNLSDYSDEIINNKVKLTYSVSKNNYVTKSVSGESAITIDSATGNTVVELEHETVTVNIKEMTAGMGTGKVSIGGKESKIEANAETGKPSSLNIDKNEKVTITVEADNGCIVNSIKIDGETPSGFTPNSTQFNIDNYSFAKNKDVEVDFAKKYTVSITSATGGKVKLNETKVNSLDLHENVKKVDILVEPEKGYKVSDLKIKENDGSEASVFDKLTERNGGAMAYVLEVSGTYPDYVITPEFSPCPQINIMAGDKYFSEIGITNEDITFSAKVNVMDGYQLESVYYQICNGTTPSADDWLDMLNTEKKIKNVKITAEENNGQDIRVYVKAECKETGTEKKIDNTVYETVIIDTAKPLVNIEMPLPSEESSYVKRWFFGWKYYIKSHSISGTITVMDKNVSVTELDNLSKAIVDKLGKNAEVGNSWTEDGDIHSISLKLNGIDVFNMNSLKSNKISITDKAGNVVAGNENDFNCCDKIFIVSAEPPSLAESSLNAHRSDDGADPKTFVWKAWPDPKDEFGYQVKSTEEITVDISFENTDKTLPVEKIEYYVDKDKNLGDSSTEPEVMTLEKIMSHSEWIEVPTEDITYEDSEHKDIIKSAELKGAELDVNHREVVYVKITYLFGKTKYLRTNGLISDNQFADEDINPPRIEIKGYDEDTLYNAIDEDKNNINDVDAEIIAKEIITSKKEEGDEEKIKSFSGIDKIYIRTYIQEDSEKTPYTNEIEYQAITDNKGIHVDNPTYKEIKNKGQIVNLKNGGEMIDRKIFVPSDGNNSNNVYLEVTATDYAGNSFVKTQKLKIDTTKPVITVGYDNNDVENDKYFKKYRTATITVKERNFNAEDFEKFISVYNKEGKMPKISDLEWTTVPDKKEGSNGDNTLNTAEIKYAVGDGWYFFDKDFSEYCREQLKNYADLAGNKAGEVKFDNSTKAANEFIIDKTAPVVNVKFDNNSVKNGKYFKKARTATITIKEHNFKKDLAKINITSSLAKKTIASPSVQWQESKGDVHTAVVKFKRDGDYTFDVSVTDLAGNVSKGVNFGKSKAPREFTVDTTIEKPEITGVSNGSAYKDGISYGVKITEINYDKGTVNLTRTRVNKRNVDVNKQFGSALKVTEKGAACKKASIPKERKNDGIYTLNVQYSDLAGNTSQQAVTFTANRFGSIYKYNDYFYGLIENGGAYVKSIDRDLVVTEYNADRLTEGTLKIDVTKDGRPLNDLDCKIEPVPSKMIGIGSSGWYQYRYTFDKSNFKDDGVYKVLITSKDDTGNISDNSKYKNGTILFRVDSTAPELTSVKGLEDAIVNSHKQTVEFNSTDAIGLDSVVAYVDDKKVLDVKNFADANNYDGTFSINESSKYQHVRMVIKDRAGNVTDTDNSSFTSAYEFNNDITVSTNIFVRWFANKPLFFGSIILIILIIGGIIYMRRRRSTDSEAA